MTAERDPVVAAALRELPVPDHLPGFWERLDERLETEVDPSPDQPGDRRVATGELPTVASLRPAPPAPAAHRLRFLAAAAVLAVGAITAGVVLRGDGSEEADPGGEQAAAPGATTTVAVAVPYGSSTDAFGPTAPVQPPVPLGSLSARDAVVAWIDALGRGDSRSAAALLGPASLTYLDALGADPVGFMEESQEGYGAWASLTDPVRADVIVPGAGTVVVLGGQPRREGYGEGMQLDAIPAIELDDGTWLVEPVAFPASGGRLQLVLPAPTDAGWAPVRPDAALRASAADPTATFWFSLDGAPAEEAVGGTWDPAGTFGQGEHLLVVAAVSDETFAAIAGVLVVSA